MVCADSGHIFFLLADWRRLSSQVPCVMSARAAHGLLGLSSYADWRTWRSCQIYSTDFYFSDGFVWLRLRCRRLKPRRPVAGLVAQRPQPSRLGSARQSRARFSAKPPASNWKSKIASRPRPTFGGGMGWGIALRVPSEWKNYTYSHATPGLWCGTGWGIAAVLTTIRQAISQWSQIAVSENRRSAGSAERGSPRGGAARSWLETERTSFMTSGTPAM